MDVQLWISELLGRIASFLPFGYAFGAGMVSAVNPCGFFMLPVYLSLYLGAEEGAYQQQAALRRIGRSIWVSLMVTLGFAVIFGLVGGLVSAGSIALMEVVPWFALVIGVGLMVLGVWMLFGQSLSFSFLHTFSEKIGDPRDLSAKGFFLFGLAYGITSLGCALPIFLALIGSSIATGDLTAAAVQFAGYVAGMGSVLLILTLGMALVKQQLVLGALRCLLPHTQKLAAFFLLAAGVYILYYWLTSGLLQAVS